MTGHSYSTWSAKQKHYALNYVAHWEERVLIFSFKAQTYLQMTLGWRMMASARRLFPFFLYPIFSFCSVFASRSCTIPHGLWFFSTGFETTLGLGFEGEFGKWTFYTDLQTFNSSRVCGLRVSEVSDEDNYSLLRETSVFGIRTRADLCCV